MSEQLIATRLSSDLSISFATYAEGARVGARAQLTDVRAHAIHGELFDFGNLGTLRPDIEVTVHVTPPTDAGSFVVIVDYETKFSRTDDEVGDDEPEHAATVSVGVAGLYSFDPPEDLTEDELNAYACTAGVMALHPYGRELIATTIQRFGLPAFQLPPFRVVSDDPLVK